MKVNMKTVTFVYDKVNEKLKCKSIGDAKALNKQRYTKNIAVAIDKDTDISQMALLFSMPKNLECYIKRRLDIGGGGKEFRTLGGLQRGGLVLVDTPALNGYKVVTFKEVVKAVKSYGATLPKQQAPVFVDAAVEISLEMLDRIKERMEAKEKDIFNPQPHYDNSKGSLYKIGLERGWNPYIFDVVKRLERGGKKDPLKQEIEKSIDVLKIWLTELED